MPSSLSTCALAFGLVAAVAGFAVLALVVAALGVAFEVFLIFVEG